MAHLPTGTVTFLFTDIEGSTRLLQDLGDAGYGLALADHRRLLRDAFRTRNGHEVETQGDGFLVVFQSARNAIAASIAAQKAISGHRWPTDHPVRVRMGLHTGEAITADAGYAGLDVHRAARICSAGHGGQILLSDATHGVVEKDLPEGIGLRDLGDHRLKDLARSHRLFQIVAPDLPDAFPLLKSLDILPNNLPAQLTSFIGREREIAEVKRLLSTTRVLTLTGSGGAGKTRLALHVAAEVLEEFKDGVWMVELASLADPVLVAKAVASAMGVPEQPGRTQSDTLADYLRSRSLLLVLDNCEHLLSACMHLADMLLRASPNLRILATSRAALGLPGEALWRVPSMSVPDPQSRPSLEQLARSEAVRLFVERAVFSQQGFAVTSRNAAAVVQVCHRLDGIPLAIELAAARVKALTVEQIADRLDDRFRLLTGGSQAVLPRQQTLRATMDWSHDLLPQAEQILLRRLSVFAGGFTLEAAEAVCRGEGVNAADVVDLLTHLVEKSLVVFQEQEARYRLLETVRRYGQEKLLESGEEAATRGRHRDWYLALAEQADPQLRGPRQRVWLDRLETEHDNLRAALEWSNSDAGGAEATLRLAEGIVSFWNIRGYYTEGREWLQAALVRSGEVQVSVILKPLAWAGMFCWRQGDYERAATLSEKGVGLGRELGNKEGLAFCLYVLGMVASSEGDHRRATALEEESLALFRDMGDKWSVVHVLSELGAVAEKQGDYERASAYYEESLALSREVGDEFGAAFVPRLLGGIALHQGDYGRAAALYIESLIVSRGLGSLGVSEDCIQGLAGVAVGDGRYGVAARLFGAAEVLRETLGFRRTPTRQISYEQRVVSTRAGLGEAAFAAAWAEGRAMTLEHAVEYALSDET